MIFTWPTSVILKYVFVFLVSFGIFLEWAIVNTVNEMFKSRGQRKTKYFSKNVSPQVTFYMTWLCLSTYTLQNLRAFSLCVYFTFTRQCVIPVVHLVYASGLKSLSWNMYFARNYNHCNFPSINSTSPLFLSVTSFCFIVGLFWSLYVILLQKEKDLDI